MYIVVAYDVEDDRRRNRLHKGLKSFGFPVQYSIFDCIIDKDQFERMKEMVKKTIKEKTDLVRYYQLCEACQKRIEMNAPGIKVSEPKTIIV